jgi:hypothetical protein
MRLAMALLIELRGWEAREGCFRKRRGRSSSSSSRVRAVSWRGVGG